MSIDNIKKITSIGKTINDLEKVVKDQKEEIIKKDAKIKQKPIVTNEKVTSKTFNLTYPNAPCYKKLKTPSDIVSEINLNKDWNLSQTSMSEELITKDDKNKLIIFIAETFMNIYEYL